MRELNAAACITMITAAFPVIANTVENACALHREGATNVGAKTESIKKSPVIVCAKIAAVIADLPAMRVSISRMEHNDRVLPPMAHSVFCLRYPENCRTTLKLKQPPLSWNDLVEVNASVNFSIAPERNLLGLAGEKWIVSPTNGDCNDYAVTKQDELLERGWPSQALLLAEVVTDWGEHHLVLLIKAKSGDYVLDNLNQKILRWSKADYEWVRIQSSLNPKRWTSVQ